MAASVPTACDLLHDRYTQIVAALASLPVGGSISEGGRSISAQAAELTAQMKLVKDEAAALGCPIGTQAEPFVVTSRARP